jgi:hypothetical protein
MKHTPGPWQHWGHDIIVKDADGDDVVICGVGKPANTRWHCYSVPSPQQTRANICLIAASPKMLAALEEAAKFIRYEYAELDPETGEYLEKVAEPIWAILCEAIDEARSGESDTQ